MLAIKQLLIKFPKIYTNIYKLTNHNNKANAFNINI